MKLKTRYFKVLPFENLTAFCYLHLLKKSVIVHFLWSVHREKNGKNVKETSVKT